LSAGDGRRYAHGTPTHYGTVAPIRSNSAPLWRDFRTEDRDDFETRQKSCTPCRGGIPPLSRDAAEEYRRQAPEWGLFDEATRIERSYRFKNFAQAFAFVERAAALAEAEGHHPDICFGWGYATMSLRTKKIKGLHENDFIMAAKLDRLAAASPAS
jgi:4a-hydroxytetrahydrobiopterin dehydratase